ncbi:triose-phosphate isomerase family protein [Ureaplasma ceti]|uniref:Triosephosphate isomerase n=1 Tax=Ureaplasma ceti TaxID=3119530 RepID=A0ABP9U9L4_9BACT
MKKYLIANFKTHKSNKEITEYFSGLNGFLSEHASVKDNLDIVLMINHLHLLHAKSLAQEFEVGSQSGDANGHGSFTSSVSIQEISEEDVRYIILGHAEELAFFHEHAKSINNKIRMALDNHMKVVLCFGESVRDEFEDTVAHLEKQLKELLEGLTSEQVKQIVLAYEPRWAIGTAEAIGQDIANEIIYAMKKFIAREYEAKVQILYGGSVKLETLEGFMVAPHIDGVLIGRESLDLNKFQNMIKVANGSMLEIKK